VILFLASRRQPKMADYLSVGCPGSDADGSLFRTDDAPGQQQVGDIGAGDEENKSGGYKQNEQR
jgi:hypothetical protein